MSRALPLAVLLVASLSLSGCGKDGKSGTPDAGTQPAGCTFTSGSASDGVKVSGDLGKDVTATFDKPLAAPSLQRTVVTKGDGALTAKGDVLDVATSLFNGKDGALLDHQSGTVIVGDAQVQNVLRAGIECVNTGSRVVSTFPAKDLFGDTGNPGIGVAATDTLVIVTDVVGAHVAPTTTEWKDAPSVTFDGRKSPQVTLPSTLPTVLAVDVIKAGDGQVVADSDTVTLNYKGINAANGKVFDETYGKGKAPLTYPVGSFVPGFSAALIGQKVGSQLIVSIPAKDGYGPSGNPDAGIGADDVMVFVIEIQATKAAG